MTSSDLEPFVKRPVQLGKTSVSPHGSSPVTCLFQVFYPDSEENEGKKRLDDDEDEEVEMLLGEYRLHSRECTVSMGP